MKDPWLGPVSELSFWIVVTIFGVGAGVALGCLCEILSRLRYLTTLVRSLVVNKDDPRGPVVSMHRDNGVHRIPQDKRPMSSRPPNAHLPVVKDDTVGDPPGAGDS